MRPSHRSSPKALVACGSPWRAAISVRRPCRRRWRGGPCGGGAGRGPGWWTFPMPPAPCGRPMSSRRRKGRRSMPGACMRGRGISMPPCATASLPASPFRRLGHRGAEISPRLRARMLKLFEEVDILLAPSTPCRAPALGQKTFVLDGETMLVRPNLGLFTPAHLLHRPAGGGGAWCGWTRGCRWAAGHRARHGAGGSGPEVAQTLADLAPPRRGGGA